MTDVIDLGDLRRLAEEHRDADQQARIDRERARASTNRARAVLAARDAAIVAALRGHVPQVEIVRVTGLTRERIRQIREKADRTGDPGQTPP